MRKKSLFQKIFGLIALISLAMGIIIVGLATWERTKDLEEALIQENRLLAETISSVIEFAYLEGILPFATLKKIADAKNIVFLWIVKPDGKIYYADDPETFGKIVDDPSLGTEKMVIKNSIYPKDGQKIKLIVSPLNLEIAKKPWSLYLGVSLKPIVEAQKRMILSSFIFLAFLFGILILISFYLAKGIAKPLADLRAGAEIIGKGNFDYKIKIKTEDEIEDLANTFNKMATDLKKFYTALEEAKTVLEIKIQARTKELQELAQRQEEIIKERTNELQKKVEELERFNRLAIGRELKMIELKESLKKCQEEIEKLKRVEKNDRPKRNKKN